MYYVYEKSLWPDNKMAMFYNQIQRRQALDKFHRKEFSSTVQPNLMFTDAA